MRKGAAWEKKVLSYDPFGADRDADVTVLRDRMVWARKAGVCMYCRQDTIRSGDRIRSVTEQCDGQIATFRICTACCDAMAKSWSDKGADIEARYALSLPTNPQRPGGHKEGK